jgi:hypothetical protein
MNKACDMKKIATIPLFAAFVVGTACAGTPGQHVGESTISAQNAELEKNTDGKGFGPQSPRDLTIKRGLNKRVFVAAPPLNQMNLCNIHFHKNAEHRGGQFTTFAGAGDGHGFETGYKYSGKLRGTESKRLDAEVCAGEHGGLQVGDSIELHYVHSTAQVAPGPTLNSCLSEANANPQLRVEAQVVVLVNDPKAMNFQSLAKVGEVNGYHQAVNIPKNTGTPLRYEGSTTGPSYNEKGSPLHVSWNVHPQVLKVSAQSVGEWCKGNVFKEDHAHGVRNLVVNQKLLSRMK